MIKFHNCGVLKIAHNTIVIYSDSDELWILYLHGTLASINYCPFCGMKLK